jgi:DNA-binding XRE family transcriptional regulator
MAEKNTTTWAEMKDQVYGEKGTERRDKLDREFKSFRIGLTLREAREKRHLTQDQLGEIINKKRSYISRVENDASNITLKTLYDIVEKGLGGKINIQIDL